MSRSELTCVPVDAFPATYSWAKIVLSFMRSQRGLALFSSTEPIVLGLQRWAIENEQQFQTVSRKNFFGVYNTENTYKNVILQIVAALIKKYIWDCKTRFSLPDLESGKDFIRYEMDRIISQSSKIYKAYFASDLNFIGDF